MRWGNKENPMHLSLPGWCLLGFSTVPGETRVTPGDHRTFLLWISPQYSGILSETNHAGETNHARETTFPPEQESEVTMESCRSLVTPQPCTAGVAHLPAGELLQLPELKNHSRKRSCSIRSTLTAYTTQNIKNQKIVFISMFHGFLHKVCGDASGLILNEWNEAGPRTHTHF